MRYRKASDLFPAELLEQIQRYVEGESIYIPRKSGRKKEWGSGTAIRNELSLRNQQIYEDYRNGRRTDALARDYFLSVKSIQRILRQQRKTDQKEN